MIRRSLFEPRGVCLLCDAWGACATSRSVSLGPRPGSSVGARVRGKRMPRSGDAAKAGMGFGTLAISISCSANGSVLWAIIHGILSWVYVVYYAIRYQ